MAVTTLPPFWSKLLHLRSRTRILSPVARRVLRRSCFPAPRACTSKRDYFPILISCHGNIFCIIFYMWSCKLLSPARAIEWMYVDSLRRSYSLRSQNATSARTAVSPDSNSGSSSKCCDSCALPAVKYYSINHAFKQCGESCIDPSDYNMYKLLEPGNMDTIRNVYMSVVLSSNNNMFLLAGLTLAETNSPCADNGYIEYLETVEHGDFTPIQAEVDVYISDYNKKSQ